MRNKLILSCLLLLLFSLSSYAQGIVRGIVTSNDAEPLPGVTVAVKGTTVGTVTDIDGAYSLTNISETATLVFSYMGFTTAEEIVNNRMSYRKIFNKKLSYQDGNAMLCSYPMIRWGEVILNRAEAYAKLNNTSSVLADVNAIRSRAGLSGNQLMTEGNISSRGYSDILDVVLDERRLELAYEGFRWKDLYRNNKPMDRRFGGTHPWEVIQPNDLRIPHQISGDEMLINTGVLPNPR